jgi:hypothetical protein
MALAGKALSGMKSVGHFIDLNETTPVVSTIPIVAYGTEDKSHIGDVEIFESIIACYLSSDAVEDQYIFESETVTLGGSSPVSGGASPYTYSWTDGSNNLISKESNPVITTGPTNNYTVTDSIGFTDIDDVDIITFRNIEHVFNPDFNTGNLPIVRRQLILVNTDNTWFPSSGDPDLFDDDYVGCLPNLNLPDCTLGPVDINCVGIPSNHFGYPTHITNASGENGWYAGLFSLVTSIGDNEFGQINNLTVDDLHYSMEGIEQELDIALVKVEYYCMDLWASLAENVELT